MRSVILLIFIVVLAGCESPQKFDWEKFLSSSDTDTELSDEDSDYADDTFDIGNSGDIDGIEETSDAGADNDQDYGCNDAAPDEYEDTADDDDFIVDEDVVISPVCGNKIIEEGEVCDGGSKSCSSLGFGTEGLASCRQTCDGWNIIGVCKKIFVCSLKPSNTEWNTVSSYEQIWIGSGWSTKESSTIYSETPSTISCRYKCTENYKWNGSACVSASKIFNCTPKPGGETTAWNTVSGYEQEWTGFEWIPAESSTEYNEAVSTIHCRYKCAVNYTWDGSACVPSAKTFNCSLKPGGDTTVWNTVSNYNQTWTGSGWAPSDSSTAYNTTESTVECRYKCAENYSWSGSACIADTKVFECPVKPVPGTIWNTVAFYEQTWNGSEWTPANSSTGYSATESTVECRYRCAQGFSWSGTECVSDVDSNTICTGQKKCYNSSIQILCPSSGSFYGQDAQYFNKCNPKSYTEVGETGNETVIDNNTGLIWQKDHPSTYPGCTKGDPVGSKCTFQEGINYCNVLTQGGKSDWRLPTKNELATLHDFGTNYPSINTSFFPGTKAASYWSLTQNANSSSSAWIVDFYTGAFTTGEKTFYYYVRCVRGEEWGQNGNFTESEVAGKIIVTDTSTGLLWQKEQSGALSWVNALSYCEDSIYAGYSDWRLPNIIELRTLINDDFYNPASNFPEMPSQYFWASTTSDYNNNSAWYVNFSSGFSITTNKTNTNYTRCVR